jgi:hypothetical protein
MSGLKEIVEELGGTVLLGGTIINFSDASFKRAFKEIYDAGAAAEREACAKLVEQWGDPMGASLQIRARGNNAA